ncbi:MAG: hypothetical protein K1X36_10930 [Pyrinomonadaceae bacterium]|nr:hypothetical protein [Pyrinomonadaceae bacterium]
MANITETIKTVFPATRVAIIGDIVADQYLNGTISRVSREAPVFILRHDQTTTLPGAAANAAANVASLGAKACIVGVIGSDANGKLLLERMTEIGVDVASVVTDSEVATTTKVRILAGQQHAARQQVIRVDYENGAPLGETTRAKLIENAVVAVRSADAVIFSDYNYGAADTTVFEAVRQAAAERGIPLLVDSRFRLQVFSGASSATPNQDEVEHILGPGFSDDACDRLREELGLESLLVTNGNKGMTLIESGREPRHIDAVGSDQAVDVTGAGDTVIAVFALGLAAGLGYFDAARLANHAGGIVVMKKGTAAVAPDELIASINSETTSDLLSSNA